METKSFICIRCNRAFKLKHHLKAHFSRKKSCQRSLTDLSEKLVITQKNESSKTYSCNFCDYKSNRNPNLKRHLLTCKKKKQKEKEEKEKDKFKENEDTNLKNIIENLQKEIQETKNTINKVTPNIITHHHTTNNTTNTTNNTLNIIVNDYGKENISYLKNRKYKYLINQMLGNGMEGLQRYIKYKYCNPEAPENLTIKYTNHRSNKLKVRQDNKWKTRDKNEVMAEIYDRDNNVEEVLNVYEHINDLEDNNHMDEVQIDFINRVSKFYDNENDEDNQGEYENEEMKKIKSLTLNEFYDCYKQNKTKFDLLSK